MENLMNKPVSELTVSDSVKINAAALVVIATPFVAMIGFDIARNKFHNWRNRHEIEEIFHNEEEA